MFKLKPPGEKSKLDEAIDNLFSDMAGLSSDSEDYAKMVQQLSVLYSLKEEPKRVSPDTLCVVAGNLLGVILIVGHERAHVITSKALLFVQKLK